MCVPNGYQIMRIYDNVNINSDGFIDKITCWQKVKISDGDTVFYSIYTKGKDGKLILYKTLANLQPLYFNNYASKSVDKLYDSIKRMYSYPNTSEVEFETNSINLTFYIDAATVKKLFFTHSVKEKTWALTREIQWFVPPKSYEGEEKLDENGRKLEYDRAPEILLRIEDFDMLKYIGW